MFVNRIGTNFLSTAVAPQQSHGESVGSRAYNVASSVLSYMASFVSPSAWKGSLDVSEVKAGQEPSLEFAKRTHVVKKVAARALGKGQRTRSCSLSREQSLSRVGSRSQSAKGQTRRKRRLRQDSTQSLPAMRPSTSRLSTAGLVKPRSAPPKESLASKVGTYLVIGLLSVTLGIYNAYWHIKDFFSK